MVFSIMLSEREQLDLGFNWNEIMRAQLKNVKSKILFYVYTVRITDGY